MKLNNKGFTVVELLASFVLTMIIVVFLFEIVLELKNVYINETVKTEVVNKNTIVATSINKMLENQAISNVACSGTSCAITLLTSTGATETKTISVSGKTITIDKQKIEYPEKVTVEDINLNITGPIDTGIVANNSIIKIEYKIKSADLNKDITFNYIYTTTASISTTDLPTADLTTTGLTTTDLKNSVVTTGNGLYKSSYESGRYIYRGADPDNYITFNNETWRIMSVESNGTLKIRRASSIGSLQWDAKGNRDSSTSTYCTVASSEGCNAWAATDNLTGSPLPTYTQYYPNGNPSDSTTYTGTVIKDSTMNTYLNKTYYNTLSDVAKSYVVEGTFGVSTPGNWEDVEDMAINIQQEKQYQWKGKVALMTITEWIQTSTDTGCTKLSNAYNLINKSVCSNNNWMFDSSTNEWTLSPENNGYSSYWVLVVYGSMGNTGGSDTCESAGAKPVVYLTSGISLSGSGTSTDPYTINS